MRLVIDDLAQRRGDRLLFEALSFDMAAGDVVSLTGPNGVGKTTLLRTIAGLIPPAHGAVQLIGGDVEASLGEQAHFIGHRNAVKPLLTVAENLTFWRDFLGGNGAIDDALEALDLSALGHLPAGYLSAGQTRRLGLARLLVAPRPVWLLDEPTTSLDTESHARVARLIAAHAANGGLVMAATHMPLGLERVRELRLNEQSSGRSE